MEYATVGPEEIVSLVEPVLLDVRPVAAHRGWALQGEGRGGHAPGAVPFPLSWFDVMEPAAVRTALDDKGIRPGTEVVLVAYDEDEAARAADRLLALGQTTPRVLAGGWAGWIADPTRPVERLPRFDRLVHPDWLASLLAGGNPPRWGGGRVVLAHVNFDNRQDYDAGHIPGAIHLSNLEVEEPDFWNRRTPEELARNLPALGIDHQTTVVLYGRVGQPSMAMPDPGKEAGQIAAMRAAAILMWAGVEDVRVLDGGLGAWERAGGTVTAEPAEPEPVAEFGREIPGRPRIMVDMDEAREILSRPDGELVSMRSWAEFVGEVSGYHYVLPKGRIQGAVFGNCGSDAYHMQNYRNCDETMRDAAEIAARWGEVGITPDKRIAFYCGTGWRASEAFFCAWVMGWNDVAVYDGGWYEWSDFEENPVATGEPVA